MDFNGVIKKANEDEITIKLKDKVNVQELKQNAINGNIYGNFEVYEKDTITELQRRHYFALAGDYSEYTGVPVDAVDSYFKYKIMEEYALEELPSLARNRLKKSDMSEYLTFIIERMVQNGVPFRKQQFYLIADTNRYLYALTMKKLCWICGKPNSDLAHAEAVGSGRNRNKIDHSQHHFMSLCRYHHQQQHQMGLTEFCKKYHIKPIKLSVTDLKELNIKGDYTNGN